eukprot:115474_1
MSYFQTTNAPFDGINTAQSKEIYFHSRRSPILSKYGMVASSQPLVSQIGQSILKQNGNAVDACIAMNAALAVTEPWSTGLGGDCFALFYSSTDRKVYGLNGSGRSPSNCTIENYAKQLCKLKNSDIPMKQLQSNKPIDINESNVLNITTPGNVAGTIDLLNKYGTMSRERLFMPAIKLAENGFIPGPVTSWNWNYRLPQLLEANNIYNNYYELTMGNNTKLAPKIGDIMVNKYIGNTLRKLMVYGKNEYYNGSIADSIIDIIQKKGGLLTKDDLRNHTSTWVDPIKINYKETIDIWEIPPNGQGIAALMALNFYESKQNDLYNTIRNMNSLDTYIQDLHTKTECMRLSYRYAQTFVSDLLYGNNRNINIKKYLTKEFADTAAKQICLDEINNDCLINGQPLASCDTVSFCAVDQYGNGCSMISSNYDGFGTGIIPKDCGFTLQNRGFNFKKVKGFPNSIGANKRPYHTIIPGLATRNNELFCTFSVMGGFMQPQGHFQVISNMIDKGMNPQQSVDAPRFCIWAEKGAPRFEKRKNTVLKIEDQPDVDRIVRELKYKYKHDKIEIVRGHDRKVFGRGQIIYKDPSNGVLWGGSDPRADGCCIGLESISKL